jgi:hypothetical protein
VLRRETEGPMAPVCRCTGRPIHCQTAGWSTIDGFRHKRYLCPVCRSFVFQRPRHGHHHHNHNHALGRKLALLRRLGIR